MTGENRSDRNSWWTAALVLLVVGAGGAALAADRAKARTAAPIYTLEQQVLRGRHLVVTRGCGDCHGGGPNPAAEDWLAGRPEVERAFVLGDYRVWAPNLTPDPETGLGRFTERQIFNVLRFGLDPEHSPDVEVTSTRPGAGNHPAEPSYLAPVMPWFSWRHMPDEDLWAIIAYLRHGLRPVRQEVPEGVVPADRWASYAAEEQIGTYPMPPFPTANEELRDASRRDDVLRGRLLVASSGCGDCHGGLGNPAVYGWLAGVLEDPVGQAPPFVQAFEIGPFKTYPRNITPDNITGIGRFSERQIFNSMRFGLRPGETEDIEIASTTPGEGNFPLHPKYLAPPMPWPAWRHMTDQELTDIAAYLLYGVKPVRNRVPDSEGPPDFWADFYVPENTGPYPVAAFPTAREVGTTIGSQR